MKALAILLVVFALALSALAQERPGLGASWQYKNDYLEVVIFPNQWPKNCIGFHVKVINKATGVATPMNKAPMFLAIRKDRNLGDFSDDPELVKLATAVGSKHLESFAFDETPDHLVNLPGLHPSLAGLCKADPLLLYVAGLRVGKKLPPGEYTMTVEAEGKDGAKRQVLEKSLDTKILPKPEKDPDFSAKFSVEGWQLLETEFSDPYYQEHTAYWMFCGVNRASKQVTTFTPGAAALRKFSKSRTTRPIGDANPDHYIFGIQTTDWFGNKDVYLKKSAGK